MKTYQEIERLLACYFAAETTEAEERELREWFRTATEYPAEWREAAMLFAGFDELSEERLPAERAEKGGEVLLRKPVGRIGGFDGSGNFGRSGNSDNSGGFDGQCGTIVQKRRSGWLAGRGRVLARVAAVAAVVALGAFLAVEPEPGPYCYIDGEAVYDRETAQATVVYLEGLSGLGESERLLDQLMACE